MRTEIHTLMMIFHHLRHFSDPGNKLAILTGTQPQGSNMEIQTQPEK